MNPYGLDYVHQAMPFVAMYDSSTPPSTDAINNIAGTPYSSISSVSGQSKASIGKIGGISV